MGAIRLSRKEAVAIRLGNQGLIEPFESAEACVRRCVAIQTQYDQSLPVAIAARCRKPMPPSFFAKALEVNGLLAKTWTVRWTLHTVLKEDIPLHAAAIGSHMHRRFVKGHLDHFKMTPEALREREDKLWGVLRREGPLTRKALRECNPEYKDMPGAGWGWDVAGLAYEGRLYVSSHMGQTTFVAIDPAPMMGAAEAQAELLRRYLRGYAPATVADFYRWSGLSMKAVSAAFATVASEIDWTQIEGYSKPFAVMADHDQVPKKGSQAKLLPKFDQLVMGFGDRSLCLPEEVKAKVFRPAGQVEAMILIDGQVAGTWRAERSGKKLAVRLEPFGEIGPRAFGQIQIQAERVRVALGAEKVELL